MKFFLVALFGVCAFAAPSFYQDINLKSESTDNFEDIDEFINLITQNIINLETFRDESVNVVNELDQNAEDFHKETEQNIVEFRQNTDSDIKVLEDELISVGCLRKSVPKIFLEIINGKKGLVKCGSTAVIELVKVRRNIKENISNIISNLNNLRGMIENCIQSKPWEVPICIRRSRNQIEKTLTELVKTAQNVIKETIYVVKTIPSELKGCLKSTIARSSSEIGRIVDEIKKCSTKN